MTSGSGRLTTVAIAIGGLVATVAVVVAMVLLWPDGDEAESVEGVDTTSSTDGTASPGSTVGEPSERTTTSAGEGPVQLFVSGADGAVADMAAAAGDPDQAIEILVYPTYAFLSYRSPSDASHIDRRSWRNGEDQDDAAPNPIDDRVDADTEPQLFPLAEVDLTVLPALIGDAEGRFTTEVAATHVIVDRFLPFDTRVLIRVYASPTDGRSGGGYVQYTLDGTHVKTVS